MSDGDAGDGRGFDPPWSFPPPQEPADDGDGQGGLPAVPGPLAWGQKARPERPSRLSRPYIEQPGERPSSGQVPVPPSVEQHPSGPFDAAGAPGRARTGPQPVAPGRSRSGPHPAGQASAGEHPSGPFDPSGAPAATGPQAPEPAGHPVPPPGRSGRQARLKGGKQAGKQAGNQAGKGQHQSGPLGTSSGPFGPRLPGQAGGHGAKGGGHGAKGGGRVANLAMAALLVVLAVGAAALVARLPERVQRTAAAPAPAAPYSSRWLCPVMPKSGDQVSVANAGQDAAQLRATLSTAAAGDETLPAQRRALATGGTLAAGAVRTLKVAPKQPSLLEVESFGAPVAVGAPGQPTCATAAAERWWLTAADTSQGNVDVVLANPGSEGAVVQLVLHASNTVYRPGPLKRVFVPAHSAISEKLNGYAELEMSVEVVALLGRVVAGALTTPPGAKTPIVIPGQPGAQPAWLFAGGRGGKGDSTSLALVNPSLDPLVVDVRVVTTKDAFTPPGFEDLEIPSGATRRVPIDVSNAPGGAMGVEVRSRTGEPFTASLVVRPKVGAGPAWIDTGSPHLWQRWFMPVANPNGTIVLANLGSSQVAATIADLGRPGSAAVPVRVPAGRVVVKRLDGTKGGVVVAGDHDNLVVTPGPDGAVPSAMVDGTALPGPVIRGPAAG